MSLLDSMSRHADLCETMLHRLNIDLTVAALMARGTMMANIVRTCTFCRHANQCAAWLSNSAPQDATAYRAFCPNAYRFDAVLRYMEFCGDKPRPSVTKTA